MSSAKRKNPMRRSMIDRDVSIENAASFEEARAIIESRIDILHKAAELLLEKEKITGAEFDALFAEGNA